MSESISIRVVVEEVVVDFTGTVGGAYRDGDIRAYIQKAIDGALELHAARKPTTKPKEERR